jgi:flagellar hook-associated protein 2
MADSLSIGSLSVSGGVTRLTGTSLKLDTETIVNAAYEAKRLPAVRLEQRIARNEARGAALGELRTLLQNLKDSVAGLRNPPGLLDAAENVFETKQAFVTGSGNVSADEVVGIAVDNRAASGGFSLEVTRLATAYKLSAQALGPAGQTLVEAWNGGAAFAGAIEIGLADGSKATVAVNGTMSADDLRAAINAVSPQTGVQASIMTVSAGERRLVLTAAETGRAIEFADVGGDAVTGLLAPTMLQAAQTAVIAMDGVAIERTENRIDDILPGVTIDLYRAETSSPLAVKVEPSLAVAKERLVGFVSAYNELRDFVARQTSVGADGAVGTDAALFGDRTLHGLTQNLSGLIGGPCPALRRER